MFAGKLAVHKKVGGTFTCLDARQHLTLIASLGFEQAFPARVPSNVPASDRARSPNENENVAARNGVTLSGLLNVLDGFYAPTNVLFMMTTNKIETLDEALLRPGRIDYKLYLGKASDRQKIELFRRFFPGVSEFEAEAFVEAYPSAETMAEFQGLLLDLKGNPPVSAESVAQIV